MTARAEPDLFDRDGELAELAELAALAQSGLPRIVLLEGPAGIGKTTLAEHFAARLDPEQVTVLRADAAEWGGGQAFGVAKRLLEPLLGEGEHRAELLAGPAGPAAAVLAGSDDSAGAMPADIPFAVLHGLHWLCVRSARRRPLVLVVDDAHLADAPTLRWLRYASRRLGGHRLLFLLTRRLGEVTGAPDPLAWLAADPDCVVIRPRLLTESSMAGFLRATLPGDPDPALVRACHQATGGNPLLAQALMRALATDPATSHELSRFTGERFAQTIRTWLETFAEPARAVAGALAVLGECPDLALLSRLAEVDPAEGRRTGEHLWQLGLLRPGPPVRWTHPLVREVIYDQVSEQRRDGWHRRAAILLHDEGAPLEQVCAHLRRSAPAGDPWTAGMLATAAGQAARRGAPDVAADHLARALAEPPPPAERLALRVQHALASAFVSPAAAIEHLGAVLPELTEPYTRCQVAAVLSEVLTTQGREPEAIEVLGRATEELAPIDPETARMLRGRWVLMGVDHSTRHRRESLETDSATLPDGTPGERVALVALAHGKTHHCAPAAEAAATAARALRAMSEAELASPMISSSIGVLTWADELAEATAFADAAIAGARRGHGILALDLHLTMRAQISFYTGQLAEAAGYVAQAQELVPEEVAGYYRLIQLSVHALVLLEQGKLAEAAQLVDSIGEHPSGRVFPAELHRAVSAQIRIERGELAAGLAELLAVLAQARAAGHDNPVMVPWRSWAVRALLRTGQRDQAVALAEEALELARRWGTPRAVGTALGLLGLATGGADGLALLAEATAELAGPNTPLELGRALLDTGVLLAETGELAGARTALRRALGIAERCGAGALAETARERLIAAGGRAARSKPAAGAAALSSSERRVVELAVQGLGNRRIAEELHLTLRTVETHLSNSYRKLGISGRAQLAAAVAQE